MTEELELLVSIRHEELSPLCPKEQRRFKAVPRGEHQRWDHCMKEGA